MLSLIKKKQHGKINLLKPHNNVCLSERFIFCLPLIIFPSFCRSETEVFAAKRRSIFTGAGDNKDATKADNESEKSPEEGDSDEVARRAKALGGLGGDVLAEMRSKQEKRASVIPKGAADLGQGAKEEAKEPENPFGVIKLR